MSRTEAQKEARKRYTSKCRKLSITIYPTEEDISKKLDSVPSYSTYIKTLIRKDIEDEQ
jgi:hypothetical protein